MRTIAILLFPDFQLLDAAGPIAAFEIASRSMAPDGFRVLLASQAGGPVTASAGAALSALPLSALETEDIDTLMVAGGVGVGAAGELVDFVRRTAPRVRRIASVCSGALVLAEAGLLDGRRATTHWGRAAELAQRYPRVKVEPDSIWVQDGPVWTSAGITAGIDLALALIEADAGPEIARDAARTLVVYHRRPAGQSQFSALAELSPPQSRFAALNGWIRENLSAPLPVEALAARAGMSLRNFARAYAAETGHTPAKAVERLRCEAARARLSAPSSRIDQIAREAGFGDPERMRRAFIRAFGQPPQALRRAAASGQV